MLLSLHASVCCLNNKLSHKNNIDRLIRKKTNLVRTSHAFQRVAIHICPNYCSVPKDSNDPLCIALWKHMDDIELESASIDEELLKLYNRFDVI